MVALVDKCGSWKPASQVLTSVTSVPTIFVQYNRVTRVGGHPLERFGVTHGPSSHGKTTFNHGIGLSFLKIGSIYALIDAEYTTPIDWLRSIMGEYADSPGFIALRPQTYEETVDAVDQLLKGLASAREPTKDDGEEVAPLLPEDTSAFVCVDSLKKLVPADIWVKLMKVQASSEKGSVDGSAGRMGQIQAAMNSAWLLRLTPLLARTRTTMMAIARESENVGAGKYDEKFKLQGGGAVTFDSSMSVRVVRAGYVREGKEGPILGERHRLIVRKTKVAGKEGKGAVAYFHTSNGVHIPPGFDTARDVLELARHYGVVERKGRWLMWRSCRWEGENVAVKKLTLGGGLDKLREDVEARFSKTEALEMETEEDNEEMLN